MIKLSTRKQVVITKSFEELARKFLAEKQAHQNTLSLQRNNSNFAPLIKMMDYQLSENGFAMLITRLKQLPYSEFSTCRLRNEAFFRARTQALNVQIPGSKRLRPQTTFPPGSYDIGPYSIYISFSALIHGNLDLIHFIPDSNLEWRTRDGHESFVHYRHLHHYAFYHPSHDGHRIGNPLTYETQTCWGNFGAIMSMNLEAGDLPEIFRSLYLFVTIQNVDSPLVNWRNLSHYKRNPDEKNN